MRFTTTHLLAIIFGGTTNYSPVIEQEQNNNIGAPKMQNSFWCKREKYNIAIAILEK